MKKSHRSIRMADAVTIIKSPVGRLALAASAAGLTHVLFLDGGRNLEPELREDGGPASRILDQAERELERYFQGELQEFQVPLALQGTRFQLQVWEGLRQIPYGRTVSYGELADRIGRPSAVRAAGAANGANPIPIIVPCHRVIGADGSLTGFGGGLQNKMHLLTLEGVLPGKNRGATLF